MLDDFRNPIKDHGGQEHLADQQLGSSQKKIALALTGIAIMLAAYLLFSSSDEPKEAPKGIEEQLQALRTRVESLENQLNNQSNQQLSQSAQPLQFISMTSSDEAALPLENTTAPSSDQEDKSKPKDSTAPSLKELIAQELATDSSSPQATEPPSMDDTPQAPAKKTQATQAKNTSSTTSQGNIRTYTVQKGDTLSKISVKVYGTSRRWKEIATANKDKVSSDYQVRAGTVLAIP